MIFVLGEHVVDVLILPVAHLFRSPELRAVLTPCLHWVGVTGLHQLVSVLGNVAFQRDDNLIFFYLELIPID